jgi:hypothetical protein
MVSTGQRREPRLRSAAPDLAAAGTRRARCAAMAHARSETSTHDLRHFFQYSVSGVQVIEDGLQEVPFGEFLVERRAITRYQLLRALQLQDKYPGVRVGECAAALGFLQISEVERMFLAWRGLTTVELAA